MKKLDRKVLKAIERVTSMEMKKGSSRWPICSGIIHQPKRPVAKKK
ncbi:MAG: cyclic lactone autoinducer peptide [Lachnospiraceae bacterium]|nr:cyclic lactone autoinducer peptide [Lachnospiraceae bacterium]